MIFTAACNRAAELCRAIAAPSLSRGCYVVLASEVEHLGHLSAGDCRGWTSPVLDLGLRPWLTNSGRWAGRGFATILNDAALLTAAELIDVALHELAHGLATLSEPRSLAGRRPDRVPRFLHALPDMGRATKPDGYQRPSWCGHEAAFIRAGIHVAYRAGLHGHRTTPQAMTIAGRSYGLSPAMSYQRELGDELREREGEPITAILTSPAPPAFSALWQRDTT